MPDDPVRLTDHRMKDGSRLFVSLPMAILWHEVRDHVARLPGARLTSFVCDGITEAWIDFRYRVRAFTINDQLGEYWFFVDDPTCPDEILLDLVGHFAAMLGR